MAPLPKRRWSSRRQAKKRRSMAVKLPSLFICPNCGKPKRAHFVCAECGFYRGKKVISQKSPKKEKKREDVR